MKNYPRIDSLFLTSKIMILAFISIILLGSCEKDETFSQQNESITNTTLQNVEEKQSNVATLYDISQTGLINYRAAQNRIYSENKYAFSAFNYTNQTVYFRINNTWKDIPANKALLYGTNANSVNFTFRPLAFNTGIFDTPERELVVNVNANKVVTGTLKSFDNGIIALQEHTISSNSNRDLNVPYEKSISRRFGFAPFSSANKIGGVISFSIN